MQRDNRDRKNENKGTSLLGIAAGTLLAGAALGVAAYLGFELYKKWTKEELELVPVFQVDKRLAGKQDECSICLEMFALNQEAKKLPCDHIYHSQCISKWVAINQNCPLCRKRF